MFLLFTFSFLRQRDCCFACMVLLCVFEILLQDHDRTGMSWSVLELQLDSTYCIQGQVLRLTYKKHLRNASQDVSVIQPR